jgi:hypothetical protein
MPQNGDVQPGTYFIRANGGKSKAGKDYGFLTCVIVPTRGEPDAVQMFCPREVAELAHAQFAVFDRVSLQTEDAVFNGRLAAQVIGVEAA